MHPSSPRYRFHCNPQLELVNVKDLAREDEIPADLIREALELDWMTPGDRVFWSKWFEATDEWREENTEPSRKKARAFASNYLTLELPRFNLLRIGEPIRLRLHSRNPERQARPKLLRVGTIDVYPIPYAKDA